MTLLCAVLRRVVAVMTCLGLGYGHPPVAIETHQQTDSVRATGDRTRLIEIRHSDRPNPEDPGWLLNENEAYVIDQFRLLRTVDGGLTWHQLTFPLSAARVRVEMYGILFVGPYRGWLYTSAGLWQSVDAGHTWGRVIVGGRLPVFADSINGWMRVDHHNSLSSFYQSHDSGESWQQCGSPQKTKSVAIPLWVSFVSPKLAWSIAMEERHPGYRFEVQRADDGGCDWIRLGSPSRRLESALNAIFFLNAEVGWLGGNGQIYHTSDGGMHWSRFSVLPKTRIVSIYFYDEGRGWLLAADYGATGGLFATDDGGRTWSSLQETLSHGLRPIPADWNRGRLAEMLYRAK